MCHLGFADRRRTTKRNLSKNTPQGDESLSPESHVESGDSYNSVSSNNETQGDRYCTYPPPSSSVFEGPSSLAVVMPGGRPEDDTPTGRLVSALEAVNSNFPVSAPPSSIGSFSIIRRLICPSQKPAQTQASRSAR